MLVLFLHTLCTQILHDFKLPVYNIRRHNLTIDPWSYCSKQHVRELTASSLDLSPTSL